jgi:hypothetical protein
MADAVLVTAALAQFGVLAYFAYFYYWTAEREFAGWLAQVVYIGGPVVGGVLCLAALKLAPSARTNIALSLCSAGFAIFAVEFAAATWFGLPTIQDREFRRRLSAAAAAEGRTFDSRSRWDVIQELRRKGQDTVPTIYPRELLSLTDGVMRSVITGQGSELLPLASISRTLTVVCNEGGSHLVYVSDEHGFHNPPGLWQVGAPEVLSLGDSFTQGFCVSGERNFVSRIRSRYPGTLNLGMAANGPLMMLATLREYASVLKPPIVLWFYFEGNDLADLESERQSPLLRQYLNQEYRQRLLERQSEIDTALRRYIDGLDPDTVLFRELRHKLLDSTELGTVFRNTVQLTTLRNRLNLVGRAGHRNRRPAAASAQAAASSHELYELLAQILEEAKRSVESWGGRMYFVYLPSRYEYDPGGPGRSPYRDDVLTRAKAAGLPVIDVTPVMWDAGDPMRFFPFRTADHYNEAGHELVARTVLSHLSP